MNSKYLIKTTNGFKEFDGIVKSQYKEGLKIYFDDNSFISVTKNHRFVDKELKLAQDLKVNDIINNKKIIKIENIISEFYDPFSVHGDNTYLVNGINNHNCNIILIDECAFINSNMFNEFMDSVAPSQSALSFKQMISTANGRNHFYDFWKDASEDIKTSKNGFVKFEVNWRDVPRFDAKGNKLEPDEFRNITIKKLGSVYFEQNYGNSFIGSSTTLIPGEILGKYNAKDPEFRYQPGLNVFEEVQPQHKYILGVDPAKDGLDYFAVQVLDITNLNFKQKY